MVRPSDTVALTSVLDKPLTIRELAEYQLGDAVAGTWRISGAFALDATLIDDDDQLYINICQPGTASDATLTNGVRVILPRDGVSLGTPATVAGSGISISGTPFYWVSADGATQHFSVTFVLDSDDWILQIDPLLRDVPTPPPVIFSRLAIDRTA